MILFVHPHLHDMYAVLARWYCTFLISASRESGTWKLHICSAEWLNVSVVLVVITSAPGYQEKREEGIIVNGYYSVIGFRFQVGKCECMGKLAGDARRTRNCNESVPVYVSATSVM